VLAAGQKGAVVRWPGWLLRLQVAPVGGLPPGAAGRRAWHIGRLPPTGAGWRRVSAPPGRPAAARRTTLW